jgi:hypothetical protein
MQLISTISFFLFLDKKKQNLPAGRQAGSRAAEKKATKFIVKGKMK